MSPHRRIRLLLFTAFGIVLLILYLTSDARRVQDERFYQQTVEAMDATAARKYSETSDDGIFQKLKPGTLPQDEQAIAVDRQKIEKPLRRPTITYTEKEGEEGDEEESDGEVSIAGRKKMPKKDKDKEDAEKKKNKGDPQVENEFNAILKKSPVIIFSKSYCPHSRKAKYILTEKYDIVPAPFVVELDEHPLGDKLQAVLASNTGRSTVPNILVNGRSIGGGDEVELLDATQELTAKIKSLGGKRVMEMKPKSRKKGSGL